MENRKISTPLAAILLAVSLGITLMTYPILLVGWVTGNTVFSFFDVIMPAVSLVLCIVLFLKRRDSVLLGALAARAIVHLLSWNLNGLLCFLTWCMLLVLALCVVQLNVIKLDMSKIAPLCKKLFFVPGVLMAVCVLITFVQELVAHTPLVLALISLITGALPVAIVFTLAWWLVNPYKKEKDVPIVQ